jgi:adenine phosphoribosyltransferase
VHAADFPDAFGATCATFVDTIHLARPRLLRYIAAPHTGEPARLASCPNSKENMTRFDSVPLQFFQDYPEPGVNFIDVGCIFDTPLHWQLAIDALNTHTAHLDFDFILAMDARGFMIAGAMAYNRSVGFAMARKAGKLPGDSIKTDYQREYGSATIEIQPERIKGGRVLIVDDVLATGGTIEAAALLLRQIGKEVVGAAAIFDVAFFKDKRALTMPVVTLRDV